jgi:hypothetical protein
MCEPKNIERAFEVLRAMKADYRRRESECWPYRHDHRALRSPSGKSRSESEELAAATNKLLAFERAFKILHPELLTRINAA